MHFIYGAMAVGTVASVVFKLLASGVEDVATGVNEASNAVLKVGAAAGAGFVIARYMKWI